MLSSAHSPEGMPRWNRSILVTQTLTSIGMSSESTLWRVEETNILELINILFRWCFDHFSDMIIKVLRGKELGQNPRASQSQRGFIQLPCACVFSMLLDCPLLNVCVLSVAQFDYSQERLLHIIILWWSNFKNGNKSPHFCKHPA